MKLYATTTSERASKGQGGNKILVIDITGQELEGIPTRENLFKVMLEVEEGRLTAKVWDYTEGDEIILYPRTSTNPPKQSKGAICELCGYIADHEENGDICRHYQSE